MSDQITFYQVNTDEAPEIAGRFGIRAIPTIVIVKNGEVVDRIVGFKPEAELKTLIEKSI